MKTNFLVTAGGLRHIGGTSSGGGSRRRGRVYIAENRGRRVHKVKIVE
jgi:hypothetical protein